MVPWQKLDKVLVPGSSGEISLYRRGNEYSIRVDGLELMNSRVHNSEEELADLACKKIAHHALARVLVGGLGMGFTVAAALRALKPDAEVVVAELISAVIRWNRDEFATLTGNPLGDPRVTVREIDLVQLLKDAPEEHYDALLFDVDNGPEALTRQGNNWLYSAVGLRAAMATLRREGILAVWSANPDRGFGRKLHQAGFEVGEIAVREREGKGRRNHTIWLARKKSITSSVSPIFLKKPT
jgi:spermidine synthase